jgi:glycosyltransferase involved in cell wall biosynthesis
LNTLLYLTTIFLILYFIYPVWLKIFSPKKTDPINTVHEINETSSVSLLYLSYNGVDFIEDKIKFLSKELTAFKNFELIIIDDNSTDKSKEVIQHIVNKNIRAILKNEHKGIPHSMNIGIREAIYEYVVFCDQRQHLSYGIISKLIAQLKNRRVGAVSSCISHHSIDKKYSLIRVHENYIKSIESKSGNLIGVYGPLYAIRKECYHEIPEYIILDDLYLTLKILKNHEVLLIKGCQIIDDESNFLYDYCRSIRYLKGFIQLIAEKNLIKRLKTTQIIMLFWHKYLRLIIPLLLLINYLIIGIFCFINKLPMFIFISITFLILIFCLLRIMKFNIWFVNLFLIISYYSISMLNVSYNYIFTFLFSRFNKSLGLKQ